MLPFSFNNAPSILFPFKYVIAVTTTSFGLLGTTFGIITGCAGPPGIFPPPITPSLSVLPANTKSLSLKLKSSSLVNLPPPNSPESLGPDCNLSNPIRGLVTILPALLDTGTAGLNVVGTRVTFVNPLSLLFLFTRVALFTILLLTVVLLLALFLCAAVGTTGFAVTVLLLVFCAVEVIFLLVLLEVVVFVIGALRVIGVLSLAIVLLVVVGVFFLTTLLPLLFAIERALALVLAALVLLLLLLLLPIVFNILLFYNL